jgi:imidazolonepropionase-like amidohydrolase
VVELGRPPRAECAAASTAAHAFLGVGGLRASEPADLVTCDRDPREDAETLTRPAAVVAQVYAVGDRAPGDRGTMASNG